MAHQHYTGTGKMHSFRGLLADGGQDKIRIEGATGKIAWRITKFEVLSGAPMLNDLISIVSIWREKQASITATTIDFTIEELLAVGLWMDGDALTESATFHTIFDNALFSRNIYITNVDAAGSGSINYYIELEEVKVSQAGMAQLAVATARRLA